MKLELKHLSPYLPYGLQISTDDVGEDWIETVIGLNKEAIETSVGNYWDYTVKPILRPLSDLTKEIEHKGDRFIPIIEYSYLRFKEIANYKGGQNTMKFIQVREQDLLFELKFDVFGLIDAGLAIDINTLDK